MEIEGSQDNCRKACLDGGKLKEENICKPKSWRNMEWYWCIAETDGKFEGNWHIHRPSKYERSSHKFIGNNHQRCTTNHINIKNKSGLASAILSIKEGTDQEPKLGEWVQWMTNSGLVIYNIRMVQFVNPCYRKCVDNLLCINCALGHIICKRRQNKNICSKIIDSKIFDTL